MKVLVFRHVPFEGIGHIAPILERRGIDCDYVDLYCEGAVTPDIAPYAGLILLGGPMSANDPLPYLNIERGQAAQAIEQGQPLLGICLGSQLIAKVLGGGVHRNPQKEIGWLDVELTEDAGSDPLFGGMATPQTVFHWHNDTWELPASAVRLASSRACRNQAFRAGSNIYGFQFHLEVTPFMIADWMTQDENCGDVRELDAPLDPNLHAARVEALAWKVFGAWCDLL